MGDNLRGAQRVAIRYCSSDSDGGPGVGLPGAVATEDDRCGGLTGRGRSSSSSA